MKKNYLLLSAILFFTLFSTFEQLNAQTKEPSKKDQRLLKKQTKKQSKLAARKESNPLLNQETDQTVKPQTNPIKENQETINQIIKVSKDLVVTKPNGNVNWTQQYIEAVGQSVIDNERFKNVAQARLMATRGAVVVAQRNLLEIVKGVQIVGETTVQDMITSNDYIYSRVEGIVKGAKQVGESKEKNGFIEVRLRMPIYGKESLANTIDEQSLNQAKLKNGFELSKELSQNGAETGEGIDGSNPILFNVENEGAFDPSLFPVIVDDNGKVLFDFSKIYNQKEGKFPQYLEMGKEILQAFGNQKGVDIINMIQTGKGEFKIPEQSSKKVFWNKVARVAQDVGAVLFKLIF